eukprot:g5205.t1
MLRRSKGPVETLSITLPVASLRIQIMVPSLWRHQLQRQRLRQSFLECTQSEHILEQHFFMGQPITHEDTFQNLGWAAGHPAVLKFH